MLSRLFLRPSNLRLVTLVSSKPNSQIFSSIIRLLSTNSSPERDQSIRQDLDSYGTSDDFLNIGTDQGNLRHDPKHHPGPSRILFPTQLPQVSAGGDAETSREKLNQKPDRRRPHQEPNQRVTSDGSGLEIAFEVTGIEERDAHQKARNTMKLASSLIPNQWRLQAFLSSTASITKSPTFWSPTLRQCRNLQTAVSPVVSSSYVPTSYITQKQIEIPTSSSEKQPPVQEGLGAFQKLPMVMPSIDLYCSALKKSKRIQPTKGIANIAKRERNRGAKQLDALMKELALPVKGYMESFPRKRLFCVLKLLGFGL